MSHEFNTEFREEMQSAFPSEITKNNFIQYSDTPYCLDGMVKELRKCLPSFMFEKKFARHWFVAGGFVRDWIAKKPPKDVDIFFHSIEGCCIIVDEWNFREDEGIVPKRKLIFETKWALSYDHWNHDDDMLVWSDGHEHPRLPFQMIINENIIGETISTLCEFDFICCMAAYDPGEEVFTLYYKTKSDIEHRNININFEKDFSNPIRSFKRAMSFRQRGWSISVDSCVAPLIDRIVGKRERCKDLQNRDDVNFVFYTDKKGEVPIDKKSVKILDLLTPIEIVLMKAQKLDDLLLIELT